MDRVAPDRLLLALELPRELQCQKQPVGSNPVDQRTLGIESCAVAREQQAEQSLRFDR